MRGNDAPDARAASTYGACAIVRARSRTVRAIVGHRMIPNTTTKTGRPMVLGATVRRPAKTTAARRKVGIVPIESPAKVTSESTRPPSSRPAIAPRNSPRNTSIVRMPATMPRSHGVARQIALKRSVPNPGITPNGCTPEGPIGLNGGTQAAFRGRRSSELRKTTRALSAAAK